MGMEVCMNRLVQLANAKFDAEEKQAANEVQEAATEQEKMADSLARELMAEFPSIITKTIREDLKLGEIRRVDQPLLDSRMYNIPRKRIPGSLIACGEFEYNRAEDGKTYVFPLAIVLTKEGGRSRVCFWIFNSYTGVREEMLEVENLEEQIGTILIERAGRVNLQFVKTKKQRTPFRTITFLFASSCWAAMVIGAAVMYYGASAGLEPNPEIMDKGKFLAQYGFFGNLLALPLSIFSSIIEPRMEAHK